MAHKKSISLIRQIGLVALVFLVYPLARAQIPVVPRDMAKVIADQFIKTEEGKERDKKRLNLELQLVEETPNVLSQRLSTIPVTDEGAIIDFADQVARKRGFFRMRWRIVDQFPSEVLETARVFFVSDADRANLGDESWGVGCGRWLEISRFALTEWREHGLRLNTTDQRYLRLLGGAYLVFLHDDEHYWLGSFRLVDRRYPEVSCPKSA